jgi:hypothetical protein
MGGIGAQVFTSATPTCPAGQHWVDDPAPVIRGLRPISACVPNTVIHLTLRPPPAPAPPAPVTVKLAPAVYQPAVATTPAPGVTVFAAPPQPDEPVQAAAPPPAMVTVCPPPWPWWWLAVAAVAGGLAGHLLKKDRSKVKRNAGRIVNAVGGRVVNRAISRAFG